MSATAQGDTREGTSVKSSVDGLTGLVREKLCKLGHLILHVYSFCEGIGAYIADG